MNKVNMHSAKHRSVQVVAVILLLIASLVILALPYTSWGFITDDFGLVWHSKVESLRELGKFFTEMGLHTFMQPANYMPAEQSFFVVLYRPLLYVFYGIQYLFFGFSAYGYLVVSALLHGMNAVLVWTIFRSYFSKTIAAFGAGYFLFHLSMLNWFGWVTAQQHLLALFFALLAFLCYQQFVRSQRVIMLLPVIIFIVCSLLTRETLIVLPVWVVFALVWHWRSVQHKFLLLVTAIMPVAGYFGWRISQFPLKSSSEDLTWVTRGGFAFFTFLKDQFLNYVTWLVDLTNLGFVPGGNRLRKGTLIILVVMLLGYLFLKCRKKPQVLFLLASTIAFAWPSVIRFYTSRFMYEALPFFVAAILVLIFDNDLPYKPKMLIFGAVIAFNGMMFPSFLSARATTLAVVNTAVRDLVVQLPGNPKSLVFVGLPFGWFCTSVAQACYMNGLSTTVPVYYDKHTFVWSELEPAHISPEIAVQRLSTSVVEIRLDKPEKFAFGDRGTNFGHKEWLDENDATVLSWEMSNDRFDTPEIVITWDYKQQKFRILE